MAGLSGGSGGSAAVRAGRAFVEFFPRDQGLLKHIDRIKRQFRELTELGVKAALAGAAVGVAMAPVVKAFTDFDDAIRAAGAKAEANAQQFDAMREKALELGRTTSFTATQIANLMTELATAGFKPEQINAATKAVLDLARATGTDAALSAKILGATLNQFSLKAEDSAKVADMLTAAANASAVGMEDLGESLKYAGPVALDLGMSLRDTIATLGALGNSGINGSEAGTALRRIAILAATGGKDIKRLFGVDTAGKDMLAILEEISQAIAGLDVATRASKMGEFFGLLGITGASVIGKSAVTVRQLQAALDNSAGIAARTAKQMDAGLGGSFRMLRGAAEGAAIAVGEVLAPVLGLVGGGLLKAAEAVRSFADTNREAATGVAAVVVGLVALAGAGAAVVTLSLAFKLMGIAIGAVVLPVKLLAAAAALLLNPFVAAGAALVAMAGHWAAATENGRRAAAELAAAFESVGQTFRETFEGISAAVKNGNLELAFRIAGEGVKAAWFEMLAAMAKAFAKFVTDNRDKIIALGALLGAIKGGKLGARLGPWGAVGGVVAGGAIGGGGADALANVLAGMGDTPALDAAAARARARLAELVAQAKANEAAAGGGAGGGAVAGAAPVSPGMANLNRVFDAIKGTFDVTGANAALQFGYGSKAGVDEKQLEVQKRIEKEAAGIKDAVIDLARDLRMA